MGAKTRQLVQELINAEERYRAACDEFEEATKIANQQMKAAIAAGATGKIAHPPEIPRAQQKIRNAEVDRQRAKKALGDFTAKKADTNKTLHSLKQKIGKILPGHH